VDPFDKDIRFVATLKTMHSSSNDDMDSSSESKRWTTTKKLFEHDSLHSAFQAADTYILRKIGFHGSRRLLHVAPWRRLPPTESQSKLLKQWKLGWPGMTRGDASTLLMRRMSGALQDFRKWTKLKQNIRKHSKTT
jgi:hypothetical protein